MAKRLTIWVLAGLLILGLARGSFPADKVRFATSQKESPIQYLVPLAAQERDLWKGNGVAAQWTAFKGGAAFVQAMAAGAFDLGVVTSPTYIQGMARGLAMTALSEIHVKDHFFFWVPVQSRFREPGDLKGAKVGVTRFGGVEYAYGRAVAKGLRLEKYIKFISTGGIVESLALLKTGAIEAMVQPSQIMIDMKLKGEVREFISAEDYRPTEWISHLFIGSKKIVKDNPDLVRRSVKTVLASIEFVKGNPAWAIGKITAESGYSEEAARQLFQILAYTRDGRIERKALENVRNFLVEYGIVPKEATPPADQMYTGEFTS